MVNRTFGRLSPLAVKRALAGGSAPGRRADGGGLYLQTSPNGSVAWIFRYRLGGRRRHLGLGSAAIVGLAEARIRASALRRQIFDGVDPLATRHITTAKSITFAQAAAQYIEAHSAGWKHPKSAQQWQSSIATFANPVFGSLPVREIDTGLVMKILTPLWTAKPTTASRLRGRIESILDWAKARGFRDGAENPARWKGHLDQLLPAKSKVRAVEHFTAMAYTAVPTFMIELRRLETTAARALEFAILTAARSGEARGATWDEVDLAARTWTIPPSRMKAGREHRVPLSDAAVTVLGAVPGPRAGLIFPGAKAGRPLSDVALLAILRRMGVDAVVHGFRSAFTDWAHERTNFPAEAIDLALAHTVTDKVAAAYRRGDQFDRRRRLVAEWADFCAGAGAEQTAGTVTQLRA
jgi:integrase